MRVPVLGHSEVVDVPDEPHAPAMERQAFDLFVRKRAGSLWPPSLGEPDIEVAPASSASDAGVA
jgi:hypothetical protein